MKSFCIKTNNQPIIHYLLDEFSNMDLDNIYLSKYTFKIYDNIILHYTGNYHSLFYEKLSKILSVCILLFFEKNLIRRMIEYHYFYFEPEEKKDILENCIELFDLENENTYLRYQYIYHSVYHYVSTQKSMILSGFVQFRLEDYTQLLDTTIDMAVNKFIIDREYREFIEVLQLYIDTKSQKNSPEIHMIYSKDYAFLVDNMKNIIPTDLSINSTKYLSDISFSSNDYILNTLLNLLPSKLTIHLIDNYSDEFINTLKLIFKNRIIICNDCMLCNMYRHNVNSKDGKLV